MAKKPQVTCIGVITVDVIAIVEQFPDRDGRTEANDIMITGGGPTSNAAVVLAKQGISTAVVGVVGDDDAGHQAVTLLENYGIDVSGITVDTRIKTQTSCIIVDRSAGTRSIVTSRANPIVELNERAIELAADSEWVHMDHLGYHAGVTLCSKLDTRPRTSLDSGNSAIADLDLSLIDLYVPTVESLLAHANTDCLETAAQNALEKGCHAVVATQGSKGSWAWWNETGALWGRERGEGRLRSDPYGGAEIVSTLGAGDVFHGALLAGLIQGFDWSAVLRRANTIAALSCSGRDGRERVPRHDELDAFLSQT